MRLRSAAFIIPLFVAVVFGFATAINAQTVTANSCSRTDVQAAVNNATRGATVTVPAGSCTWSSTLSLTQGITLTGAGVGSTVITSSGGVTLITVTPDSTAISNSENIKVTGFTFDGSNSSVVFIQISGAGDTGTKPYRNLIIGDNKFQNGSSGPNNGAIRLTGQVRGVIYHNTFDRCNIILRPMGNDSTTEWSNTAYNQFSYGSSDNLYFEDNTILWSSAYTSADGNPGWIESGQGGRVVVRYNSWNLANLSGQQEFWDVHGFQNFNGTPNSGQTGTMVEEYYGNTMINGANTVYRWMNHRGSWGMMFDNTYSGASNPGINANQYDGGCPGVINPTPTNYNPVINNTYFFNDAVNGSNASVSGSNLTDSGSSVSCNVAENANWWQYNASCTASSCSAGIGRGTSAPTGSCTTGTGYWVASTATPTTSSSVIQNGQFYKCTATNTWTAYYTPYTYPHPLRAGSSASSSPAAPTNLTGVVQ
jgi:hypothetical protein